MADSPSADFTLRELTQSDAPALQALLERCSDYYERVVGCAPGPAEAQGLYAALPEGVDSYERKLLAAIELGDRMVGVVDIIRDWPQTGTWILGLLMLEPAARERGLGSAVAGIVEERARSGGALRLRIGVAAVNDGARRFWERLGYEEAEAADGARVAVLVKQLRPAI